MAISITKLNGVTLKQVSGYDFDEAYLGGLAEMANGDLRRQLVRATPVRTVTLTWAKLTTAELAAIRTAFAPAMTGSVLLELPDGTSFQATASDGKGTLNIRTFVSGKTVYYKGTISLREA